MSEEEFLEFSEIKKMNFEDAMLMKSKVLIQILSPFFLVVTLAVLVLLGLNEISAIILGIVVFAFGVIRLVYKIPLKGPEFSGVDIFGYIIFLIIGFILISIPSLSLLL